MSREEKDGHKKKGRRENSAVIFYSRHLSPAKKLVEVTYKPITRKMETCVSKIKQ